MKAWFFSIAEKRLRYNDNREIALGTTHTVDGTPIPCEHGLHASVNILDAVKYAPGPIVWEVELGGTIVEHEDHDKQAATERTYLRGGIDVSDVLRAFARWSALSVAHLWGMPDVVRRYLDTGDESLRDAASAAASATASAAAWAAAWNAARDAAWASAWAAAWNAARDAAWAAARDAARAAARAAAWNAACAARATARDAAWATAWDAAWAAARDAALDEKNKKLTEMIEAAITAAEVRA